MIDLQVNQNKSPVQEVNHHKSYGNGTFSSLQTVTLW